MRPVDWEAHYAWSVGYGAEADEAALSTGVPLSDAGRTGRAVRRLTANNQPHRTRRNRAAVQDHPTASRCARSRATGAGRGAVMSIALLERPTPVAVAERRA